MNKNKSYDNLGGICLGILAGFVLIAFCLDTAKHSLVNPQFAAIVIAGAIVIFLLRKNLSRNPVIWVMAGGIFLKLCYIIYTEVWCRQHDVIDFGYYEGHAAYIEYILNNHHLPDFDPRTLWGFFQPPLHHIISAAWMWLQLRLGLSAQTAQENVQLLTLTYMAVVTIVTYFICKELDMKRRGMLITMLIASFHPILILFSGSINNDALALCLSMIAVYITLLWYAKPTYGKIVLLGISIGLAMFAKLTSGLVAPAIGVLMLYSLITNKEQWKKYIGQFIVFGGIVFPIGLYWPIRNKILWDMPINYIPEVGEQLEKSGFVSRVLDIRTQGVYPALIANGYSYDEYNTVVMIFKSSLFGEYDYGQINRFITPFAVILFIVSIVLALAALYATCALIFSKRSMMGLDRKLFFGILYITFLIGYLSFSLGYNNFSAQDFRYSALAIIVEAVFLGLWADESEEKYARWALYLSIAFAAASAAVYFLIGIFQ